MTELFENTIWPAFIQKMGLVRSVDNYRDILNDFYRFTGHSFELCQSSDAKEYDKYLEQLEYATDSRKIKHSAHVRKISALRSIGDFVESCNFVPGYENPFNQVAVKAVDPKLMSEDMPTVEDLIFSLMKKIENLNGEISSLKEKPAGNENEDVNPPEVKELT